MTMERVLADLYSDRVKRVIHDGDFAIEMDDQYALAFCIGSEKIELLGATAATFGKGKTEDFALGMECCYKEIERVYDVCGVTGKYPVFHGAPRPMGVDDPVMSDAVQFIIDTAHSVRGTDEIIYLLATGCAPNIASAFYLDPSIKENICVVWLGGTNLETDEELTDECNLGWNVTAGQYLLSLDVPLILLPAYTHGTNVLEVTREDFNNYMPDDNPVTRFYRDTLPDQFSNESYYVNGFFKRSIFDVAAPGILTNPEAYELKIIPAPVITDEGRYAFCATNHKIIYMERMQRDPVLDATFKAINNIKV